MLQNFVCFVAVKEIRLVGFVKRNGENVEYPSYD